MLISFLMLFLGIFVLVYSGNKMVESAASLARSLGVSGLIIGLTIVAFGTSSPELIVGVRSVTTGVGELASANVIGSNIANVLLALGIPATIMAIPTNTIGVARNASIALFASILLIVMVFINNPLLFWQSFIFCMCIIIYLLWMYKLSSAGSEDPILYELINEAEEDHTASSKASLIITLLIGIGGLLLGGHIIVRNAVLIATNLNISETVIGLTIVAVGTSLPEITTVIIASYRGQPQVALGGVIGSNIFNLLAVLGISGLTGPIDVSTSIISFDIWIMLLTAIALVFLVLRRKPIGRKTGVFFLFSYAAYLLAIINSVM
ncbi:MAG: calcium/sodium antiporter [Hellea sp.]|nr:calcium/sodium antiporter [Hellea sp.]